MRSIVGDKGEVPQSVPRCWSIGIPMSDRHDWLSERESERDGAVATKRGRYAARTYERSGVWVQGLRRHPHVWGPDLDSGCPTGVEPLVIEWVSLVIIVM